MRNEHDVRPIRPRIAPVPRHPLHDVLDARPGREVERANGNIALDHRPGRIDVILSLSKGAGAHGSVSSACVKSAKMSSIDSIPTDNRTASSLTPLAI